MFRNQISLFVVTFLVVGLFFLVLPEKGFSGIGTGLGCCVDSSNICIGCGSLECAINGSECIAAGGVNSNQLQICLKENADIVSECSNLPCCRLLCNFGRQL